MNNPENKKLQWLPALSWLCVLALLCLSGRRYNFLTDNLDFSAKFDWLSALLNSALVLHVLGACFLLGKSVSDRMGLKDAGTYFRCGLGVLCFNVLLLPLFFLNLFYTGVLAALMLALFVLLRREIPALLAGMRGGSGAAWLLFGCAAFLHILNAAAPVSYAESLGDVAGNTFYVPMLFAQHHGAYFTAYLGPILAKFCQYEVLGSALISLANPGIVKIFGLALLLLTAFGVKSVLDEDLRAAGGIWAAVLLLTAPVLCNDSWFSFAHERVYQLFASFFIFVCVLKGVLRGEAKWHFIGIAAAGVLLSISAGGVFTVLAALVAVALFPQLWRAHWRGYALALLAAFALAAVFPAWNYANTGSPAPVLVFLNKYFPAFGGAVFNDYLAQRTGLFFAGSGVSWAEKWLLFPPRFLFGHFGLAALGVLMSAFYFVRPLARASAPFVLLPLALAPLAFPQIVRGEENGRFLWDMLPLLSLLASYGAYASVVLFRGPGRMQGYEKFAADCPRAARFFAVLRRQAGGVNWRKYVLLCALALLALYAGFAAEAWNVARLAARPLYASFDSASQAVPAGGFRLFARISGVAAMRTGDFVLGLAVSRPPGRYSPASKLRYLCGLDTLGQYLGEDNPAKDAFLNAALKPGDKVLYFFHAYKIYCKAEKQQPSIVAAMSGIYSADAARALALLRAGGISYLCFDNKWGIADRDPGKALLLDALTPLFEPEFFSRHFVPVETGLPHFYLFRVDFQGLAAQPLTENRMRLGESGFFCELYEPLKKIGASARRLAANPYAPETMLAAFETYKQRYPLCYRSK